MKQKIIEPLLEKKVTRKQFLYMLGMGVVGITGFSNVVDMMTKQGTNQQTSSSGFGSGLYGGNDAAMKTAKEDRY